VINGKELTTIKYNIPPFHSMTHYFSNKRGSGGGVRRTISVVSLFS
jgi:hypothetical protein